MTPAEFKKRWESDADGGGICLDEVAECAVKWGICSHPKTQPPASVLYRVLLRAETKDAEEFKPSGTREWMRGD